MEDIIIIITFHNLTIHEVHFIRTYLFKVYINSISSYTPMSPK
jgi:hypothetical protein